MALDPKVVALLKDPNLAHFATVSKDGKPHVTPVWVDTDGEAVLINTAKGRVKHKNVLNNPYVAISVNDKNDFYNTFVMRGKAELVEQGAEEHIDMLAKKYLNVDKYPWRQEGEQRIIIRVIPNK